MMRKNLTMKSEKNSFDANIADLIDKIFESHDNGELSLVCVEHNGEVLVGFVEVGEKFNEGYYLQLPIHLIECTGYDEMDNLYSSYKFFPYRQLADIFGEIYFSNKPNVIFTPSDDIVESFVAYWMKNIYNTTCDSDINFDIMTATKS